VKQKIMLIAKIHYGRKIVKPPSKPTVLSMLSEFGDLKQTPTYWLDRDRAEYWTSCNRTLFYQDVAKFYHEHHITSASQILNCDETDVTASPRVSLSCPMQCLIMMQVHVNVVLA
jgi:hypothetical protein